MKLTIAIPPLLVASMAIAPLSGCGGNSTPSLALDNGARILEGATCNDSAPATCPGEAWPEFELEDYQPNSPFAGTSYGLEKFEGKATLVALLASY